MRKQIVDKDSNEDIMVWIRKRNRHTYNIKLGST